MAPIIVLIFWIGLYPQAVPRPHRADDAGAARPPRQGRRDALAGRRADDAAVVGGRRAPLSHVRRAGAADRGHGRRRRRQDDRRPRARARLGAEFLDADDLHPPANRAKMARGVPLDDTDRAPWLAALHELLAQSVASGRRVVLACSALKAAYREVLLADVPGARVVYLRADRSVLARRLASRRAHFFPPALLDSQLATLEEPADALVIDATLPVEEIVARITCRVARASVPAAALRMQRRLPRFRRSAGLQTRRRATARRELAARSGPAPPTRAGLETRATPERGDRNASSRTRSAGRPLP